MCVRVGPFYNCLINIQNCSSQILLASCKSSSHQLQIMLCFDNIREGLDYLASFDLNHDIKHSVYVLTRNLEMRKCIPAIS